MTDAADDVVVQAEADDAVIMGVEAPERVFAQAGATPNQLEADGILSEMHACLTTVLARV